ncbi:MAG: hypothetical protein R3B09_30870 [Nannocystaceae bacterium]
MDRRDHRDLGLASLLRTVPVAVEALDVLLGLGEEAKKSTSAPATKVSGLPGDQDDAA